jgi:hypothetical protein
VQIEFKKVSAAYSEELSDVIQMHLVIRKLWKYFYEDNGPL